MPVCALQLPWIFRGSDSDASMGVLSPITRKTVLNAWPCGSGQGWVALAIPEVPLCGNAKMHRITVWGWLRLSLTTLTFDGAGTDRVGATLIVQKLMPQWPWNHPCSGNVKCELSPDNHYLKFFLICGKTIGLPCVAKAIPDLGLCRRMTRIPVPWLFPYIWECMTVWAWLRLSLTTLTKNALRCTCWHDHPYCHSVGCPPLDMSPRALFSSEYCPLDIIH